MPVRLGSGIGAATTACR